MPSPATRYTDPRAHELRDRYLATYGGDVSSPFGIVQGSSEAVEQGTDTYLWVLGLISLKGADLLFGREPMLRAAGVQAIFGPGTNLADAADEVLRLLGHNKPPPGEEPAAARTGRGSAGSVGRGRRRPGSGRRSARVEIALRDGRRLMHLQPNRKGDPELPLTDADLEGKLVEFAAPVIGADAARALAARLWTLDTSETLP